jgi:putative tryptophan/tyrosine transport system substrate-binding protein
MKRRKFITLLGGAAAAWPLAAWAQQPSRMRRIGILMNLAENDPAAQKSVAGFRRGLQDLGWIENSNVRIDMRWGGGDRERYRIYASELIALEPDVLLGATTDPVIALQRVSQRIPIVFVAVIDPVGSGIVASMPRPGGNATGFTIFEYALSGKWLELLREVAPGVKRVAVLRDSALVSGIGQFAAIQTVAPIGFELGTINLRDGGEVEAGIAAFAREPNRSLIARANIASHIGTLWNVCIHSGLKPANLTNFAHFAVSSTICLANSAGDVAKAVTPTSVSRALNFGSASPAFISLLSLLTTSFGVPLGATMPHQPLAS